MKESGDPDTALYHIIPSVHPMASRETPAGNADYGILRRGFGRGYKERAGPGAERLVLSEPESKKGIRIHSFASCRFCGLFGGTPDWESDGLCRPCARHLAEVDGDPWRPARVSAGDRSEEGLCDYCDFGRAPDEGKKESSDSSGYVEVSGLMPGVRARLCDACLARGIARLGTELEIPDRLELARLVKSERVVEQIRGLDLLREFRIPRGREWIPEWIPILVDRWTNPEDRPFLRGQVRRLAAECLGKILEDEKSDPLRWTDLLAAEFEKCGGDLVSPDEMRALDPEGWEGFLRRGWNRPS
jgi:hypothetical protein